MRGNGLSSLPMNNFQQLHQRRFATVDNDDRTGPAIIFNEPVPNRIQVTKPDNYGGIQVQNESEQPINTPNKPKQKKKKKSQVGEQQVTSHTTILSTEPPKSSDKNN